MAHMQRTLLLLAAYIAASRCLESIDLKQPIVRTPPNDINDDAYFGYSVVLHQVDSSSDFDQSLDNTRIIVGAPKATLSAGMNTGGVYICGIRKDQNCALMDGDINEGGSSNNEMKDGQFMGGSLASNGDQFIACGHRYVSFNPANTNTRNVFGRCYSSGQDLQSFRQHQPCLNVGSRVTSSFGVCHAGMSVTVAKTSSGDDFFGIGAPGTYLWRGVLIRLTPSGSRRIQNVELNNENSFGWQGYSITKGFFRSETTEDFAMSIPRLLSYFGAVHIVQNSNSLQLISQNLRGSQMGEYYGFSLVALNLAGDNLHELLVSAPMYRDINVGADTGRVYVYSNTMGVLSEATQLIGVEAYSRFGHAMASLGDISGDGFDDVAISAPFSDGGGKVYIYHSSASSSQRINPIPQQIISPSSLNLMNDMMMRIQTLGTSLASSVDVDGNRINDLAIGSYTDQTVVLLRTRPLARIETTIRANPSTINIRNGTNATYEGVMYPTFNITLTLTYTGEGTVDLTLNLTAETARIAQGLQQRLFFDETDMPSSVERRVEASSGDELVEIFVVFVKNDITDFLTGFVIDLNVEADEFNPEASNGNPDLTDLSDFPVVNIVGPDSLQVEIQTDCDSVCIAGLSVSKNGDPRYFDEDFKLQDKFTVGLVTEVVIPLTIMNERSNAFLAQLTFDLPHLLLSFTRINDSLVTCNPRAGNAEFTPYTCEIGNPFRASTRRNVQLYFRPTNSFTGVERTIDLTFEVDSLNEGQNDLDDNMVKVTLEVDTQANIFVDEGIVFPDQVNHASDPPDDVNTVTDLGPNFLTTFTIGNQGPSTIPSAQVNIHWPLDVKDTDRYFLYPTGVKFILSDESVSGTCDQTYFNPGNLTLASSGPDGENTGSPGGGRRRRSLRSKLLPRTQRNVRVARQAPEQGEAESVERNVSCLPDDRGNATNTHSCVIIVCTIDQLSAGDRVQIEISAHVDERHLGGSADSFTFFSAVDVEVDDVHNIDDSDMSDNSASATFRSVPLNINNDPGTRTSDDENVPWYAIVIPIVAAVILIIVVGVVLYFCGFFRRKNKKEIEEQARENLAEADGGTAM